MSNRNGLDSFAATERSLQLTRERLPGYPTERVRLARLLVHIQRGMEQSSNRTLKPYGLSYSTYNALMMLYGAPDFSSSPSELAEATGEKRTNITRICDELLANGFIERHQSLEDRRKVVLRLTDMARQTLEAVQPPMWAGVERLYAGFSATEIETLRKLLSRQLGNMERGEE